MWRDFYASFVGRFSGKRALRQAAEQNRLERFSTFPNFEASAKRCGQELQDGGLSEVAVESFPADGTTSWYGWKSMKAWDVTEAHLWMTAPDRKLLCDWSEVPESLVMYSGPCDVEGELVEWNGEEDVDLAGKIPFTRHRVNDVFPQMRAKDVRGIVSDFLGTLPGVRDPFDLPDDVRWENSALRPAAGRCWGFMLNPRQGDLLRSLLRQGMVRLHAKIASSTYDGAFHSATGVIPGAEEPEKEILFVSHLYEPGAISRQWKSQVDHAARNETSLLMHLRPELVDLSQLPQARSTWPQGVGGEDPRDATATYGRQCFQKSVELVRQVFAKAGLL